MQLTGQLLPVPIYLQVSFTLHYLTGRSDNSIFFLIKLTMSVEVPLKRETNVDEQTSITAFLTY